MMIAKIHTKHGRRDNQRGQCLGEQAEKSACVGVRVCSVCSVCVCVCVLTLG